MSFDFYLYRAAEGLPPLNRWTELHRDVANKVHFIIMNNAAPSTMRKVCEAFKLNCVAAPEADDLVDVYAYDDNDRFYAKKNWRGAAD